MTAKKGAVEVKAGCWEGVKAACERVGRPYALELGLGIYYGTLMGKRMMIATNVGDSLYGPTYMVCGFRSGNVTAVTPTHTHTHEITRMSARACHSECPPRTQSYTCTE